MEGIGRSLAMPSARPYWSALKSRYMSASAASGLKVGLAVALAAAADESLVGDLIELAVDKTNGQSRVFFIKKIAKSRSPLADAALNDLERDPDVAAELTVRKSARARRMR
jgi:hypothetical protein